MTTSLFRGRPASTDPGRARPPLPSQNERLRRLLRARLSPLELKRLAPALGFAPDARPRDLDARQWAAVFAFTQGRR